MTAKDWFGVVVRTLGLWIVYKAVLAFLGTFTMLGAFLQDSALSEVHQSGTAGAFGMILMIALEMGIGVLLLRKAGAVVGFAFPPRAGDPGSATH